MEQARAVKSVGALPLTVLSRGRQETDDADWQERQKSLVSLSSRSQQSFAERSGHGIPTEQPDAAVAAIVAMVLQVR